MHKYDYLLHEIAHTSLSQQIWAYYPLLSALLYSGITPRKHDIVSSRRETPTIDCNPSENITDKTSYEDELTLFTRQKRISLTFRKVLHEPCTCKYSEQCDSQQNEKHIYVPENANEAVSLGKSCLYRH